jgi:arylsulfatase A-like enzyme
MSGAAAGENIVVVVLDSARALSMLSQARGVAAETPNISRLALTGCEFEHAIAPGNWTVPSHMSMFTGVYPWVHGRRTFQSGTVASPTIASWLARRGYATGLFSEEVHLIAGYGLEEGFADRYCPVHAMSDRDRTATNRWFGGSPLLYSVPVRRAMGRIPLSALPITFPNYRAEIGFKRLVSNDLTIGAFDRWVTELAPSTPFHAFLNLVDPHEPYEAVPVDGARTPIERAFATVPRFYLLAVPELRARAPWKAIESWYRTSIREADRKVGAVLDSLARSGRRDRTWVIVTSDHGQSFGEGGNVYHGCGASDSVTRVPLVIVPPAGTTLPKRVSRYASLCELPSWLKAISLGRPPFDAAGFPTIPFAAEPAPNSPVYCEGGPASDPNLSLTGIGTAERWNHRLIAAYVESAKYVLDTYAGDLRRWSLPGDPDSSPAQSITGDARAEALHSVFGLRDDAEIAVRAGLQPGETRPPLRDPRMRSWGYD